MLIHLEQSDIEESIRHHVKSQGLTRKVTHMIFTMGRGPKGKGLTVDIDFEEAASSSTGSTTRETESSDKKSPIDDLGSVNLDTEIEEDPDDNPFS